MKYYLAAILMLTSVGAHAELHKWVDSSGKVHYSDTAPPAESEEQKLNIPAAPSGSTGDSAPGKSIFEREADLKKAMKERQDAEQQAQQKQQEADKKKADCVNARNSLNSLENAPRIATYDDKGNQVIMDDTTRQQKIEDARKAVGESCN
jgi:hypothetical protein